MSSARMSGAEKLERGSGDVEDDWQVIEQLVEAQRYSEALTRARGLLDSLREGADEALWARALIQVVQLETGLHGYERAVKTLQQEPWPREPTALAAVALYYAQGLTTYRRAYSWEIEQREEVASRESVGLAAWTGGQIAVEAGRAYSEVWSMREALGEQGLDALDRYLEPNSYPAGIRDTLRDAVTYLWVNLLVDTSLWQPRQSNELFRLDLRRLITGDADDFDALDLEDPAVHPLERMSAVLADLEAWHREADRPQAALEARLERLQRLGESFAEPQDRSLIRGQLVSILETFDRRLPWWSVAAAELAELWRSDSDAWSLTEARRVAVEGAAAHPESVGGRRCRYLVAAIEAPDYSLAAMVSDGLDRRSIEVTHRNLERLHFRAWKVDIFGSIESSRDFSLLPGRREIERKLGSSAPDFAWTAELDRAPDYRRHRTFVVPAIDAPGLYLVVASVDPDFDAERNELQAVYLAVSDLVLVVRREPGAIAVTVRSGATGRALAGSEVSLYRYDYREEGHRLVERLQSGADGRVRFSRGSRSASYFLVARSGNDVTLDPAAYSLPRRTREKEEQTALLFTDRSVYRPDQDLFWKAIAYRGRGGEGRFETVAGRRFTVELIDANGELVERAEVVSNEFGSASGSFQIPGGRLLGGWRLRTSIGGSAAIRVEEYKRPTFEVEVHEPAEPLRLNRQATLAGEARYYFGLPVVEGAVRWRVTRLPVYPRWWWWFEEPGASGEQTVAAGEAGLDPNGRFEFSFLPAVDERRAASGITYRYRASVEVTDAGGETRSAERSFRLGFVAVEARIERERAFVAESSPSSATVRLSDLDGVPRTGTGSWRLVGLMQPAAVRLPADLPLPPSPSEAGARPPFETPGDRMRPRWDGITDPAAHLRSWEDGDELLRGDARHGDDGLATIRLPALAAGAYRLYYRTEDAFGAELEEQQELVVVAGGDTRLALPIVLWGERSSVPVGETVRLFAHSGLDDQELVLEIFRGDELLERRELDPTSPSEVVEVAVRPEHRGGIAARLTGVRDHQLLAQVVEVFVPWDDRRLAVSFSSFRDRLKPGDRERWSVTVEGADESALARGSAELLAYMYDRSLDLFAPHEPADPLSLYPRRWAPPAVASNLGVAHPRWRRGQLVDLPADVDLRGDRLVFLSGYGIGGMGRQPVTVFAAAREMPAMVSEGLAMAEERAVDEAPPDDGGQELRSDFAETAFWEPHLRLDDAGTVSFEFTVPDSLTEWSIWVHALTSDLRAGRLVEQSVTVRELMVRPYLPRFLREGDRVDVRLVVNNAGDERLTGTLDVGLVDPVSGADLAADFGLDSADLAGLPFSVAPGGGESFPLTLSVPARLGEVAIRVEARAGDWSDGEIRALPVLPGRMHLVQSRFAALRDRDRRVLSFRDMAAGDDPTLLHEQLVVTLDAQLFYGVLHALPYLVSYPYECTEQTLNRFLSTGIVSTLYDSYPAVKRMAREFAERETRLEPWVADDPNRAMALEETPWLAQAAGGREPAERLINVLDPRVAAAQRRRALAELERSQTAIGGFPWWPGGPPSPHMTLYLLAGFSRALEFGVEVPKPMVQQAWSYMHRHYLDEMVGRLLDEECCWEMITYLNYVLSSYPDESWTGGLFEDGERRRMLDFSFRHWKRHSPLLKGYLTLTLERAGRSEEARMVFASVMDSAKTDPDLGTFWAPEERAWLWYNDTIESHAFALRVLNELDPEDERRAGLVHWLFLNRKLNHWKSTRATAEVIYALVHYLDSEGALGAREAARVSVGARDPREFVFEPDSYSGRNRQVVIAGEALDLPGDSEIVVEKETPGLLFASATWHFSTERLPAASAGDFFSVTRRYFKRALENEAWTLTPLAEGESLAVGDQVEVQLAVASSHAAEYVHLRDPRPAGFEPETLTSGYRWKLGISWYEEIRDSGTNFFFEWLPAGEYTLTYRLRANLDGRFKAAPAELQSMYAPEFAAYSAGDLLTIGD